MQQNNEMNESAPPVVEDARLPEMDAGPLPGREDAAMAAIDEGDLPEMPDGEESLATAAGAQGSGGPAMDESQQGEPAMSLDAPDEDTGAAYLRLVVQFDPDGATVTSARLVDGELARSAPAGELMYQALVDGRPVAAGGLPDVTVAYGTPPEDDLEAGHSSQRLDAGEFVVRVPREEVTFDELTRLSIELTSPDAIELTPAPGETLQDNALAMGIAVPDTLVTVDGVNLDELPNGEAEALRARLG